MLLDLALGFGWLWVLFAGLGLCALLRARGVRVTYVRDLLHVGTAIWVFGWPWWQGVLVPLAIVLAALLAVYLAPAFSERSRVVAKVVSSVSDGEERWLGIQRYVLSYAVFTLVGLTISRFVGAAALLALSFGDGLGGLVGRRLGRHRFSISGGKSKTVLGSVTVFAGATFGVLIASFLAPSVAFSEVLVLGLAAALAEGFSPRATDNLTVPIVVGALALLLEA